MQDKDTDIKTNSDDEQEIDLLELARKLWSEKRIIIKWAAIAAVAGIIIAFSIPKEYTATIKLAPEAREGGGAASNLGALAAMAGINANMGGGKDAVSPTLYPDIVGSIPFAVELFDVPVTVSDNEQPTTVRKYLTDDISAPWWSYITGLPSKAIGGVKSLFSSSDSKESDSKEINTFRLTPEENGIVGALASRVSVDVDGKTSIISISVTMQDPLVSALLADTVAERLKEYVVGYRTNKARSDLEYTQKLTDEARDSYYTAQQNYASYMDQNHGVIRHSIRNEEERLQNEMQLAFNLYNTTAQQLQMAKAKVQEITPVYTVVQPSTVPLAPSKPSKMLIIVGCIFLAVVAACAWILFGKDLVKAFKKENAEGESHEDSPENAE